MGGMKWYSNGVQQKLKEAFAQQELTAIITLLLYAFISWVLRCGKEEDKKKDLFFLFQADILIKELIWL